MQAGGGSPPQGSLAKAIDAHWGSLDKLTAKMNAAGAGVQGSGWVVCSLFTACLFTLKAEILLYCIITWEPNVAVRSILSCNQVMHWILQWLALNKEVKRLSVETTANQVCDVLCSKLKWFDNDSLLYDAHLIFPRVLETLIVNSSIVQNSPGYTGVKGPCSFTWN